jgi:hypothetical protein
MMIIKKLLLSIMLFSGCSLGAMVFDNPSWDIPWDEVNKACFEDYLANFIFDHIREAKGKSEEDIARFLSAVGALSSGVVIDLNNACIVLKWRDKRFGAAPFAFRQFIAEGFGIASWIGDFHKDASFAALQKRIFDTISAPQRELGASRGLQQELLFMAPFEHRTGTGTPGEEDPDELETDVTQGKNYMTKQRSGIRFTRTRIMRMAYGLFITVCAVVIPLIVWKVREDKKRKIEKVSH